MYGSLLQMAPGSRDLSQAEKKITVNVKLDDLTTIFTQNDNFFHPGQF